MKANSKILKLVEHGLKSTTLAELTPKQIDALYSRLVESKKENKEEVKQQVTNITFDPSQTGDQQKLAQKGIHIDPATKKITMTTSSSGSITETNDAEEEDIALAVSEKDPNLGLAMSDDLQEKFESKKQQKYFFAKCGDGKTKEQKKWCKMAKEFADSTKSFKNLPEKKKENKEEFDFGDYNKKIMSINTGNLKNKMDKTFNPTFEQKLQESIEKMVQKHIRPKISKKDFINTITEAEKEVETPVKPDVDTPSRPKPSTPYQPKHQPAPKAKEKEIETPVKPDVDTPSRPKPSTPYQPKHQPAPKAGDLPDWLSFGKIGINLK
jgi:hypothetical protein